MSKYDLVAPSSMGVRITPEGFRPVHIAQNYFMHATSAESNVLNIPASLGMKTKVLTAFVKDSPIAAFIKNELSRRHIEYEGPDIAQDGPWGLRHQFNIADSGYGARGPRVWNDRAGEVGRMLESGFYDLDRLFTADGVRIIHMSGLIAALSPQTAAFCMELARLAHGAGTKVCFDLNYRASFWKGREKELRDAFSAIAAAADILVGNEEDFQLALGISGPKGDEKGLSGKTESFKTVISDAEKRYPNVSVFATTLREAIDANRHMWGAVMLAEGQWHEAPPREISVLDRIGGGDAFVSGLLYGILKGCGYEDCIRLGWAGGAMAVTAWEDYASPADEEALWSIWNGNARVRR